ncbi:MAG TPA: class I SAM-dependent methyltransferase [Candidatus Binatia bacterium]|jgi:SAM-dependent methyltransferase|nr:class I SAM-dependent methyltransferase [Candidatus Binatia bacterium]
MEAIFSRIYRDDLWRDGESRSGWGSTLERTDDIRRELPPLLRRLGVKSLLDAPCGDWNWMREVDLAGVEYTGIDVVREIIAINRRRYGRPGKTFLSLDFTREPVPSADAILCRETLIHLSLADGLKVLENFKRSGARYLLISNYPAVRENTDVLTGHWRKLNMELAPFGLAPPIESIAERAVGGLCLGVWRMADL